MKKKLPKVYQNKISKNILNDQKVFYSDKKIIDNNMLNKNSDCDILKKIDLIFNSNSFVYKARVNIKTKEGEFLKDIIGKTGNYLLTLDNEKIYFNTILDIYQI